MSDGPFRDDGEAARARAEALEGDLAREKAENERLRAELERAHKPPLRPVPPPRPGTPPRHVQLLQRQQQPRQTHSRWQIDQHTVLKVVLFSLPVMAIIGMGWCVVHERRSEEWYRALHESSNRAASWRWMTRVGTCVRATELRAQTIAGLDAETTDPRRPGHRAAELTKEGAIELAGVWTIRRASSRDEPERDQQQACLQGDLAADTESVARLPGPARGPFAAWVDRERSLADASKRLRGYYTARDYLEDDYRGASALWTALRAALAERDRAVAELRTVALPAIREAMLAEHAEHEQRAGRDATWWRAKLGLDLEDLIDLAHCERRAGASDEKLASAIREPARLLVDAAKQAPIEVRRVVRSIEVLDRLSAGDPTATWPAIEALSRAATNPIWDRAPAPTPPSPPIPD